MSDSTRRSGSFPREENGTGFTAILARLLAATPGALGAALVDASGEAVDYTGTGIDPYELKVAAAYWRIVLQDIDRGPLAARCGTTRCLMIQTGHLTFVLDALPEGYALLSILKRNAAYRHVDCVLDVALRELYQEGRWPMPPGRFRWHPVEVEVENFGRPIRVRGREWRPVHIIGTVAAGLVSGELGFRVGVHGSLLEMTLVLGRDRHWYADVPRTAIG